MGCHATGKAAAALALCLLPGASTSAHALALTMLLVLAGVRAVRARADPRALPGLIDILAMSGLALVALLGMSGDVDGADPHHGGAAGTGGMVITVITLTGWAAMRWADARAQPVGATRGLAAAALMLGLMATVPHLH